MKHRTMVPEFLPVVRRQDDKRFAVEAEFLNFIQHFLNL